MTKKLMEEKQKADSRIAEVEQDIEAMKLKLEEVLCGNGCFNSLLF